MILNGGLAGLVAITAPCAFVSVPSSLIIGLLAHVRDRLEPPQVPAEEEHAGLDIGEHGISAYPEFRISGAGTASAAMDVSTSRVGTPAVERAR
jgi:ammonia channel protein AmtB